MARAFSCILVFIYLQVGGHYTSYFLVAYSTEVFYSHPIPQYLFYLSGLLAGLTWHTGCSQFTAATDSIHGLLLSVRPQRVATLYYSPAPHLHYYCLSSVLGGITLVIVLDKAFGFLLYYCSTPPWYLGICWQTFFCLYHIYTYLQVFIFVGRGIHPTFTLPGPTRLVTCTCWWYFCW